MLHVAKKVIIIRSFQLKTCSQLVQNLPLWIHDIYRVTIVVQSVYNFKLFYYFKSILKVCENAAGKKVESCKLSKQHFIMKLYFDNNFFSSYLWLRKRLWQWSYYCHLYKIYWILSRWYILKIFFYVNPEEMFLV